MQEQQVNNNDKAIKGVWRDNSMLANIISEQIGSISLKLSTMAYNDFQNIFLYGTKMRVYKKGKIKQMQVYLDNLREKLLWFSTSTKAFLIDLYFTSVCLSEEQELAGKQRNKFFLLKNCDQDIILLFDSEADKKKYFIMFTTYIEELRKRDPKYSAYFSYVNKMFALDSTKNGKNMHSESDLLEVSAKIGLSDKVENKEILEKCMAKHKVMDRKKVPHNCVAEYFRIMFCSRKMQTVFEEYSKQKLGEIRLNPTAILDPVMSVEEFAEFLRTSQQEDGGKITQIVSKFSQALSFFDFCIFLYDEQCSSISQPEQQDEDHPLTDYFCFSSHNTYLSGNQLTSDCKVSRYSDDLENGLKCVELDIHNDGSTPIVTHAIKGTGLCKPILFEDVIKEVDRFSEQSRIEAEHYPIILSLENHASENNKQKIMNILTKYFGDSLYTVNSSSDGFPSLSSLKNKIVVKTSSSYHEVLSLKKTGLMDSSNLSNQGDALSMSPITPSFGHKQLLNSFLTHQKFKKNCERGKVKFDQRMSNTIEQLIKPISSMAKVTSIFKSKEGIKNTAVTPFECTSMTNAKVLKTKRDLLQDYTKKAWLRTYPLATEMSSGNYDPAAMMEVGAQIIALNTQTKDYYAWMMYGYFCSGLTKPAGLKGYILKPKHLRSDCKDTHPPKARYRLKINIIESNNQETAIKFYGLEEDMKLNEKSKKEFVFSNINESFIVFNIGEDYRDCVATRFIAAGYRILIARNKESFRDSGVRVLVHVGIRME